MVVWWWYILSSMNPENNPGLSGARRENCLSENNCFHTTLNQMKFPQWQGRRCLVYCTIVVCFSLGVESVSNISGYMYIVICRWWWLPVIRFSRFSALSIIFRVWSWQSVRAAEFVSVGEYFRQNYNSHHSLQHLTRTTSPDFAFHVTLKENIHPQSLVRF